MDEQILVAGCVLLDDYGRILLLHRGLVDAGLWYLPGGKVEEDELPEEAAVREVREELGVAVNLTKTLGDAEFELEGVAYKFYWFQGVIADGTPQIMEPEIFDDLDYAELEDLPSLALSAAMEALNHRLITGEVVLD